MASVRQISNLSGIYPILEPFSFWFHCQCSMSSCSRAAFNDSDSAASVMATNIIVYPHCLFCFSLFRNLSKQFTNALRLSSPSPSLTSCVTKFLFLCYMLCFSLFRYINLHPLTLFVIYICFLVVYSSIVFLSLIGCAVLIDWECEMCLIVLEMDRCDCLGIMCVVNLFLYSFRSDRLWFCVKKSNKQCFSVFNWIVF